MKRARDRPRNCWRVFAVEPLLLVLLLRTSKNNRAFHIICMLYGISSTAARRQYLAENALKMFQGANVARQDR